MEPANTPPFLQGSGQMAALVRHKDWASTAIGPIEQWPQSLRTIVSTCLNSRFPILIWWGPELKMIYNDAYAPLLGARHPAALGSRGAHVWSDIWPVIGPMLEAVLRLGQATWCENQHLRTNRHGFEEDAYFTFSYSPIYVESGGIGGVFTAVTETTATVVRQQELMAHNESIRQINAQLEHRVLERTQVLENTLRALEASQQELTRSLAREQDLSKLKSQFVSLASHEFRTPLTVLQTSLDLVERYTLNYKPDKLQKHFHRIQTNIQQLTSTLEEFLSLSQLDEGKLALNLRASDARGLIQEVVTQLQAQLKAGQRITTQLDCPPLVWLDSSLVHKVLLNILTNAIKYSGPGSLIRIEGAYQNGQLSVRITDQGLGISEEDQRHLFERFYRAARVSHIAGTGLGLSLVRSYLQAMGGEVSVHSELGVGTRVELRIPCPQEIGLSEGPGQVGGMGSGQPGHQVIPG
jgi:signal transduction histidine kinase